MLQKSDLLLCQARTKRSFLWKQTFQRRKEKPRRFDKVALQKRWGCQSPAARVRPRDGRLLVGRGHRVARLESRKGRLAPRVPAASRGFPQREIKCSLAEPWPAPPRPLQRNRKARGPGTEEGRCGAPSCRHSPGRALRPLPWAVATEKG